MGADWPARPRALVDRRSDADSPWEVCLADEQIRDWETVYAAGPHVDPGPELPPTPVAALDGGAP